MSLQSVSLQSVSLQSVSNQILVEPDSSRRRRLLAGALGDQHLSKREVKRGCDFEILAWSRHEDYGPASTLDQPSIVSGLGKHIIGDLQCLLQRAAAKYLRGLHSPEA